MKLFQLIKSVIVLFVFSGALAAANTPPIIPYYGQQFYQDYQSSVSDDALVDRLKTVLRSFHVKQNGSLDLVVTNCFNVGPCYQQQSLRYQEARKIVMNQLYMSKSETNSWQIYDAYCGRNRGQKDFGGKLGQGTPDNKIMNVEHTWPQSKFSRKFLKEAQKSDLHHLFPTDSLINMIRGSNPFGEVVQDEKILSCPESRFGLGASGAGDVFEPPSVHRGNVARALFYFSVRYDLPIDPQQEAVLRKWNHEDPVDDAERARNNTIYEIQKNRNPFVDFPELVDRISGF